MTSKSLESPGARDFLRELSRYIDASMAPDQARQCCRLPRAAVAAARTPADIFVEQHTIDDDRRGGRLQLAKCIEQAAGFPIRQRLGEHDRPDARALCIGQDLCQLPHLLRNFRDLDGNILGER